MCVRVQSSGQTHSNTRRSTISVARPRTRRPFLIAFSTLQVDLRHIDEVKGSNVVKVGIDLSEFYTSVEWDILEVPAVR